MTNNLLKMVLTSSLLALSTTSFGYDKQDEAIINQKMAIVENSVKTGQIKPILDMMPPKIFAVMGQQFELTADEMKAGMLRMTNHILSKVDLSQVEYTYYLDKGNVLTSKTGREYMVIPTNFTTQGVTQKGHLVTISDDNTWYIIRIESPYQIDLLKQAYPDIQDIPLD